jgi:Fe-Mn family superoxide dismutase
MHTYTPQTFQLPDLKGISPRQVEIHLGLYQGYVKNINALREEIAELTKDADKHAFAIESVRRRLGFEFNGMRLHELYFEQWEGGAQGDPSKSPLAPSLVEKYGSLEGFVEHFRKVGMSRGSGWTTFGWDAKAQQPHVWWTADHELGMLADVKILLTMDMWEHAYMIDYAPAEKSKHIDAFFANLNWSTVEKRFADNRA